jgi:hypothetical protein
MYIVATLSVPLFLQKYMVNTRHILARDPTSGHALITCISELGTGLLIHCQLTILICKYEYKLCNFLHPAVTPPPQILSSATCSQTPTLLCSFRVRDKVSQPYRTTGKTTVL